MLIRVILGNHKDKIIDSFNTFLCNLYNVRTALIANHFHPLIGHLLYFPIVFIILSLNVIRIEIAYYIMSFALLMFALVITGLVFTLMFMGAKGSKIVTENH